MTKIFSALCLRLILAKSDSTGDEFQSIDSTVLANPSHEKVDLVIAMSVAMAYIKKTRDTYFAIEYSYDTEVKLNGNCMG